MQTVNTKTYGTTGLPKFGAVAIDGTKSGNIAEMDAAFNHFLGIVKGLTAQGNEIALAKFSSGLESLYWPAYNCVAGKPVIGQ